MTTSQMTPSATCTLYPFCCTCRWTLPASHVGVSPRNLCAMRHPMSSRPGTATGPDTLVFTRRALGDRDGYPCKSSCRYIPGAGDDEETWSQGLEPGTFWRHITELLAPGPLGIAERARSFQLSAKQPLARGYTVTHGSVAEPHTEPPAPAATASADAPDSMRSQDQSSGFHRRTGPLEFWPRALRECPDIVLSSFMRPLSVV